MKKFLSLVLMLFAINSFAENVKKIAIVRYKIPPHDFIECVNGFKSEMNNLGFIEGKNVEYLDFLTSTSDMKSTPEVQKFVNENKDKVDLFVTLGWVGLPTREIIKGTKIPQIYNLVFRPFGEKITGTTLDKASGSNITGVYLTYPPEKIVKLLKLVKPNAKKYGIVINSQIPADGFFKKWYEEATSTDKNGVEFVYYDLAIGLDKVIEAIKKDSLDAFGGGVGLRQASSKPLFSLGIPLVTAKLDWFEQDKVKGTDELIAHYNPFDAAGIQIAKIAKEILSGKNPGEMIPQAVEKQLVFINLDAATRLKINIPTAVLKQAAVVIK